MHQTDFEYLKSVRSFKFWPFAINRETQGKRFINLTILLSLTACATGTEMQAQCETKHSEFPSIFQCTYDEISSRNPSILQDAKAKLYLLRGEQLALAVVRQQMSSLDAKVEWQRLYVQLKEQKEQEATASMLAASQALRAVPVHKPNPNVTCTSTKIGASMYTTCQ